jgi:hypothetical protein
MILHLAADEHPEFRLPSESDTRTALLAIGKQLEGGGFQEQWIRGAAAACPESFRRDGSIGYVYVGDGLRFGDVVNNNILILFCSSDNHRATSEHSHGWRMRDGGICAKSNLEIINELEQAIANGKAGTVSYSERAMEVLRSELARRQR